MAHLGACTTILRCHLAAIPETWDISISTIQTSVKSITEDPLYLAEVIAVIQVRHTADRIPCRFVPQISTSEAIYSSRYLWFVPLIIIKRDS